MSSTCVIDPTAENYDEAAFAICADQLRLWARRRTESSPPPTRIVDVAVVEMGTIRALVDAALHDGSLPYRFASIRPSRSPRDASVHLLDCRVLGGRRLIREVALAPAAAQVTARGVVPVTAPAGQPPAAFPATDAASELGRTSPSSRVTTTSLDALADAVVPAASRVRDHRAIYQRRNEIARSLGYDSYAARRRATQAGSME